MQKSITKGKGMTIGMDLGDRKNRICVLNADGKRSVASVVNNKTKQMPATIFI
ncbi:MAG: hypothetical protein U9P49_10325 [Thermodesulfobacteriota bacterium]|nr:hypothetical protein [Thermodesulfobacteriota bacterium]